MLFSKELVALVDELIIGKKGVLLLAVIFAWSVTTQLCGFMRTRVALLPKDLRKNALCLSSWRKKPLITIDGLSASGKSTAGKEIARIYDLPYVYVGLIFRGLVWSLRYKVGLNNRDIVQPSESIVLEQLKQFSYKYHSQEGCRVCYQGVDITKGLKDPDIDHLVSTIADNQIVRDAVSSLEQTLVENGAVVDSRDAGSFVFPNATHKFFFSANFQLRVNRRRAEWLKQGLDVSLQDVAFNIRERDYSDASRSFFRLRIPEDAIYLDTTAYTRQGVVDEMVHIIGEPYLYQNHHKRMQFLC